MKRFIALILMLVIASTFVYAQESPGITINLSGSVPQDSLNKMVHKADSVQTWPGSYETQEQRRADSVAQAAYRTNLLLLKVNKADTISQTAASYETQSQRVSDSVARAAYRANLLLLKVNKADTASTPTPANYVTATMRIADQATIATKAPSDSSVFTRAITADGRVRGVKTFAHAAAVDTLVVSGFTTSTYLQLTPVWNSAGDTTGFKSIWVKSIKQDTAFVLQTTSGAYVAIHYDWQAFH